MFSHNDVCKNMFININICKHAHIDLCEPDLDEIVPKLVFSGLHVRKVM